MSHFNLRPARLQELTTGLQGCYAALQHDLSGFRAFLQQVDRAVGEHGSPTAP